MGNGLFAYTIYAFLFIGTFNSATNCMQVGRQILTLISPHDESPSGSLLRFIAIVALTVVCLLHYFSPAWGRALNLKFALTKIALLLALVIAGGVSWARHEAIARFDTSMPIDKSDYAKALLVRLPPLFFPPYARIILNRVVLWDLPLLRTIQRNIAGADRFKACCFRFRGLGECQLYCRRDSS